MRDSAKKSWSTLSTSSVLKVGLLTLLVSLSLGLPLMLLTAFPARAAGQGNSSATSQTSEPLLPFTGVALSQSRAPEAGGFGMDLGSNTYAFSQGGWSWARPGGNFTIEFASSVLSLDSTNVPIMPIAVKNSSIVEHQFSTEVTVASSSCTPSVYFAIRNTTNTNAYDRDIVIAGSLGCSVPSAAIHLQFANPLDLSTSDCDTDNLPNPCSQVLFGNMGLSWEGMSCNYDNSSLVLSCAIGSSFYYDPVALDGSGVHGCSSATSCTVTLTTSDANDVVIVGLSDDHSSLNTCASYTISDTSTLSWTCRKVGTQNNQATVEFWAVASGALGSDTITVSTGSTSTFQGLVAWGVSGANTGTPFDSNGALPHLSGTGDNPPDVKSVSTSNANDFVFAIGGDTQSVTQTAGTCDSSTCTLIQASNSPQDVYAEYRIVSSTQSGITLAFGSSQGGNYVVIGDAIQQASSSTVTQPISCTTANSAPSATMTLSGASVSPTTLSCDGSSHNFTASPSSTITITVPTDGGTSRYRLAAVATSTTVSTCSSGTCSGHSFTIYYQYSQSVSYAIDSCDSGATCSAPNLSYTQSGSSTYSTLSTGASTYWIDYGTTATVPSSLTDSLGDLYYPYSYSWSITSANIISNPVTYWCGL